jgi:hypothetical protein
MLCDSLEIKNPSEIMSLELTNESLNCAIAMIEEVFLPSMGYLLKNEIIMSKIDYDCRKVEKIMKEAGGKILRADLIRKTHLIATELNKAIFNLTEKECVEEKQEYRTRPQGGGNQRKIYIWIGD